eukprot:308770-Prorocentrum_minimum.AAC.3
MAYRGRTTARVLDDIHPLDRARSDFTDLSTMMRDFSRSWRRNVDGLGDKVKRCHAKALAKSTCCDRPDAGGLGRNEGRVCLLLRRCRQTPGFGCTACADWVFARWFCGVYQSLMMNDDFQHILRIVNTNVDGKQKIPFAVTAIRGVGRRFAILACKKAEIDVNKRCADIFFYEYNDI